jgi:hypothetical protein
MRGGLAVPFALALALAAETAFAQQHQAPERFGGRPAHGAMNPEERQRLREDLNAARRDLYRERPGGRRMERDERGRGGPGHGRLSPQQREQLRRDILDANRELRR